MGKTWPSAKIWFRKGRVRSKMIPKKVGVMLMLPRHARCVLSHPFHNKHSFQSKSFLSSIGRIESPLCNPSGHPTESASHLIRRCPARTLCDACFLANPFLSKTSAPGFGELPGFRDFLVSRRIFGRGQATTLRSPRKFSTMFFCIQ